MQPVFDLTSVHRLKFPNAIDADGHVLEAPDLWESYIEARYRDRAEAILRGFARAMGENVLAHSGLLAATIDVAAPALIVLIVPEEGEAMELRRALAHVSLPNVVVQEVRAGESGDGALPESSPAHGKTAIDNKPTAYVCIGPQCSLPVTEPAKLVETVKAARAHIVHSQPPPK